MTAGTTMPAGRSTGETTRPVYTLAESDLRLVADSIPHIVWVGAADGSTEFINRWAMDYSGATEKPDNAENLSAALHSEDLAATLAAWDEAQRTGCGYEVDYRLRRADGQYRWHHFRNLPLRDDSGAVVRWIGTATDIHDQKALEETLRRSERATADTLTRLESLLAAAPVGIGFVDRDFRFVQMNEMLVQMTGGPEARPLGRTVREVAPDLWPHVEPFYRRVLDAGEIVYGVEVSGPAAGDPDRTRSWLASYYPVREGTDIIGVGVVTVDITDRREAEEFRSIVMENMAEGLYTVDEDGSLISMNRAASALLGWREDELRGRHMHSAVHFHRTFGAAGERADSPRVDQRPAGQPVRLETATMTRKDGTSFPVSYSAAPLRVGTKVGGLVVVFHDISDLRERQQREIETRHDQKMESLGRLSAGIAHEVNTPIQFVGDNTRFLATSCQQMLDLLLVYRDCLGGTSGKIPWEERLKRTTEAEIEADVDYLAEEVPLAVAQSLEGIERVATLVRAMKSFSYRDSNDQTYANLNEALETTLTVARNEVKYVADVKLDLGELPDVLCHIGDLNQVFLNLLVNAADAMHGREGRGEIRISTRVDGPMAVIRIADDGCGVPADLHQLVFEPFFTTKEVGKGTGQGLALARAVVCDKHGGTIDLLSAPGEGTEFVLRLPIDGKRTGTPAADQTEAKHNATGTGTPAADQTEAKHNATGTGTPAADQTEAKHNATGTGTPAADRAGRGHGQRDAAEDALP